MVAIFLGLKVCGRSSSRRLLDWVDRLLLTARGVGGTTGVRGSPAFDQIYVINPKNVFSVLWPDRECFNSRWDVLFTLNLAREIFFCCVYLMSIYKKCFKVYYFSVFWTGGTVAANHCPCSVEWSDVGWRIEQIYAGSGSCCRQVFPS